MLIFLYFENFVLFWCFFELLENMCHTTQAVGQTLKEKQVWQGCEVSKYHGVLVAKN